MRRGAAALPALLVAGCLDNTGILSLSLVREGPLSFDAENEGDTYPVALSAGQVLIDDINLVAESSPVPTQLLAEPVLFDFFAQERVDFPAQELPPKGFDEIHIIFDNAADGALSGIALSLAGTVTLTDGTVASLAVSAPVSERVSEQLQAAVTIPRGDDEGIELLFDPSALLNGIDFDALAVGGAVSIEAGTGDPNVDAALAAIESKLILTFSFDGPTGGSNL